MKKFLCILLSIVMLFSVCAIGVSAEDQPLTAITGPLESGTSYRIPAGTSIMVEGDLNIPLSSGLYIEEGASLTVTGYLNCNSDVIVDGHLTCGAINVDDPYSVTYKVSIPALDEATKDKLDICYYIGSAPDEKPKDADYTVLSDNGEVKYVEYGTYLFLKLHIAEAEGEDRYNDALYPVFHNNSQINLNGTITPVLISTPGTFTFGSWPTDETVLYNTYTIDMTVEKEGYTVEGRNGQTGIVEVKWGQAFSFHVVLEEDYNKSEPMVYVYNGDIFDSLTDADTGSAAAAQADESGYYTIQSVRSDYTVQVVGVIKNETLDVFAKVLDILSSVWKVIVQFFNTLFGGTKTAEN